MAKNPIGVITGKFKLLVLDADKVIYEGEATSVFVQGDRGEFELLPYHFPVLSVLKKGVVIIDWDKSVAVERGIIRFFKNECVVIVE